MLVKLRSVLAEPQGKPFSHSACPFYNEIQLESQPFISSVIHLGLLQQQNHVIALKIFLLFPIKMILGEPRGGVALTSASQRLLCGRVLWC